MNLTWKLNHPDAIEPTKAYIGDAGYDLHCLEAFTMAPHSTKTVRTGVKYRLPPYSFLKLETRSSLAKSSVSVEGGVCDRGYTGEIYVILKNSKDNIHIFKKNAKIAQAVLHNQYEVETKCIPFPGSKSESEHMETDVVMKEDRGSRKFGSSD